MFERVRELADRVKALDIDALLETILNDSDIQKQLVALNQEQLLAGKGADGNSLPTYESDPYFKTIKAARVYENWKAKISPNPNKPKGVIDLFINGYWQSTIKVVNAPKAFTMENDSKITSDIQNKTGGEALGISEEFLSKIRPVFKDLLLTDIRNAIFQ